MDNRLPINLPLIFVLLMNVGLLKSHESTTCNLTPLETRAAALQADNRFVLTIDGVDDKYIPNQSYTIRLKSIDKDSPFIAFTIYASGDKKDNERNPRKKIPLDPGRILNSHNTSKSKEKCPNAIFESDISPKTEVQAKWIAPPKENQCVTIFAYVAIKPDIWFNSDGPLTKHICEDRRKAEDMLPKENDNCQVCEEARYEMKFEGTWSYNTHPAMFPVSKDIAKFSDIVGASHTTDFNLFRLNSVASEGLKMLAEQGNTSSLEVDIVKELGSNVRTILKASGPPKPNMTTMSSFRASRDHHMMSLVASITPSPDWFLGVANLELCEVETGTWVKSIRLNLYPLDAGTDSGATFEASNDETSPPQPISSANIAKGINKENIKPFAKLKIDLVRTYSNSNCIQETTTEAAETGYKHPGNGYRAILTEAHEATDPSITDCPVTPWQEWGPCEGVCTDNEFTGYQTRSRNYIVNGVEYTFDGEDDDEGQKIPPECEGYSRIEWRKCQENC